MQVSEPQKNANVYRINNSLIVENLSTKLNITYQIVDPELAKLILRNAAPTNRKISNYRVRKFIDLMLEDKFTEDGVLTFDKHDKLINGQHRLQALIKLNQVIGFIIVKKLSD